MPRKEINTHHKDMQSKRETIKGKNIRKSDTQLTNPKFADANKNDHQQTKA